MTTMQQAASIPQANYNEEICTAIKRAMAKQGWTYDKLAKVLGKNLHTVWNWLNGRAPLPAGVLPVFAKLEIKEPLRIIAKACNSEFKPDPNFLRTNHSSTKPIQDFQMDSLRAVFEVNKAIDEGWKDFCFDKAERESVRVAADQAIIEILELVAKVIGEAK